MRTAILCAISTKEGTKGIIQFHNGIGGENRSEMGDREKQGTENYLDLCLASLCLRKPFRNTLTPRSKIGIEEKNTTQERFS